MKINLKAIQAGCGVILAVGAVTALTWKYNPVAHANQIKALQEEDVQINEQYKIILWQTQLNGVKDDIRDIKKTPVADRSDFEKKSLEDLITKKNSLEQALSKALLEDL